MFTFTYLTGTNPRLARGSRAGNSGEKQVAGKQYLMRQAMTLLKFAQTTTDPNLAVGLLDKAADLKAKVDESTLPDPTPRPADVDQRS